MKKSLVFLVVVIALAGGAFAYLQYNKPHRDTADEQAAYILSAPTLFAEYELEEAAANTKYLDKLLLVKGELASVTTAADGTTSLMLTTEDPISGISVQLLPGEEEKLAAYEVGDEIGIKGICTGKLMDVVLVRGVIIEE